MEDNWYQFKGIEQLDTPSLILYPERMLHNIRLLKSMISPVDRLRPHIKTNKSIEVTKLMMQHGINKFKCATIAEAEMLGNSQAADALLAYQPTQAKLERLIKLIKCFPHTKFSCLVDNKESAKMISDTAEKNECKIHVYIDLNVGMNRTGIKAEFAFDLFMELNSLSGIKFNGFHAYDGHIRDINLLERADHCGIDFDPVEKLRQKVKRYLDYLPLLIAGGSPTCILHSQRENVECSPGTFIFWDKGYHDTIPEQDFLFAALVITRVISLPDDSTICIDLGYKAISSENDLQNRVYFINQPQLKPYSHSEEHMVIEAGKGHSYQIGDVLYVVPMHICPTVAMYDHAYTVQNNQLNTRWPINSRGRG